MVFPVKSAYLALLLSKRHNILKSDINEDIICETLIIVWVSLFFCTRLIKNGFYFVTKFQTEYLVMS